MKSILKSWIFWLGFSVTTALIGAILNISIILLIGLVILSFIFVTWIIYAFIINLINSYCNNEHKVINKGHHRVLFTFPFCLPRIVNTYKKVSYLIDLTDTATSSNNHLNKLFGNTIGNRIHNNSFRFAYSEVNKELYAYYYINGKREYKGFKLYNNGVGKVICSIERYNDYVMMSAELGGNIICINIPFKSKNKYGWKCGPYYGGETKAPHDVRIYMKKLK